MNLTHEVAPASPLVSIVDDDPSVRSSARRLLRSSGLQAEAFASGDDFLRSEFIERTDCLLLDVYMPGMNGLELQQRLTEMGRRIPIVFLSAKASEEEERQALQGGAAAFLHKPARQEALLQAIRAAISNASL
ncbi:response regulator [Verrucomicrobium sp. BvORR106]|uniref:response regulator transcription factor n=1 Tax=Verrucomicrobium sp. BvORR106 TaxID=1403819 RepID=UPI0005702FDA|nr:response regulator [Verrucomicrobium sp. BvORR106]